MPATWYDCLDLKERPRWDRDGGLWYVSQTVPKDGSPTTMYRHKPTVNDICAPLFGASIKDKAGKIIGVRYPPLDRRLCIYREGIELVSVFRDYDDLILLAMHRRQVTQRGGIPADELFFNLALEANFSREKWLMLAERMPDKAPILQACHIAANLGQAVIAA